MSIITRAILFVLRKNSITIIYVLLIITLFIVLQIGFNTFVAAEKEKDSVLDSIKGSSFCIETVVDHNDESLWTESIGADGKLYPQYHSPVLLTENLASKIMNNNNIIVYNAEKTSEIHTSLKVKPGFGALYQKELLEEPEKYHDDYDVWEWDYTGTKYLKNHIKIYSNTDSSLNKFFRNGAFELIEGRHITPDDRYCIVISDYFADINNLKIGDVVPIDISEEENECIYVFDDFVPFNMELEIIGIFHIGFDMEVSEYTWESEMPENVCMVDNNTMKEIEKGFCQIPQVNEDLTYYTITFFVKEAANIDDVIEEIKKDNTIKWQYLDITKDDTEYKNVTEPLEAVVSLGAFMITGSLVGFIIIVFLVTTMMMKKRKRETGILLAVGITKKEVLIQFICEALICGAIALVISVFLTGILINPIGNVINKTFSKDTEQNYTAYLDERMNLDIDLTGSNVKIDYSGFEYNGVMLAIGFTALVIPVIVSAGSTLKKHPSDFLSE